MSVLFNIVSVIRCWSSATGYISYQQLLQRWITLWQSANCKFYSQMESRFRLLLLRRLRLQRTDLSTEDENFQTKSRWTFVFNGTDWKRPSTLIFLLSTPSISYHCFNICVGVFHAIIISNELQFYSVMLLSNCVLLYIACVWSDSLTDVVVQHTTAWQWLVIVWKMLKHVSTKMLSTGNWTVLNRNLLDATQNTLQHKHLFMSTFKVYVSINLKFINGY